MFKKGDRVYCKPGYETGDDNAKTKKFGGNGYSPNHCFIIDHVYETSSAKIYFPSKGPGVYEYALKDNTQYEIY